MGNQAHTTAHPAPTTTKHAKQANQPAPCMGTYQGHSGRCRDKPISKGEHPHRIDYIAGSGRLSSYPCTHGLAAKPCGRPGLCPAKKRAAQRHIDKGHRTAVSKTLALQLG